ncbi:hypothetical protein NMY22_g20004 [Coprinellus aureogranulatus]|nr:hypothetical protein NMY22_g20004 [Coprinellus aureogranulatus]
MKQRKQHESQSAQLARPLRSSKDKEKDRKKARSTSATMNKRTPHVKENNTNQYMITGTPVTKIKETRHTQGGELKSEATYMEERRSTSPERRREKSASTRNKGDTDAREQSNVHVTPREGPTRRWSWNNHLPSPHHLRPVSSSRLLAHNPRPAKKETKRNEKKTTLTSLTRTTPSPSSSSHPPPPPRRNRLKRLREDVQRSAFEGELGEGAVVCD